MARTESTVIKALKRLLLSPAVHVAAIVAVGTAYTASYAMDVENWFVMTDELLYQRIALDALDAVTELPTGGDASWGVRSVLYPLLIALPYELFSTPVAFEVVHGLNAFFMASTAIPAYLLARGIDLPRWVAYFVAALTVSVPWMTQSMIIWTEVAAYPAFTWAVLGMHTAMARPSWQHDLLALGGLVLAYLARTQFSLLALAFPVALLVHHLHFASAGGHNPAKRLVAALVDFARAHRVLAVVYGFGAVAAVPAVVLVDVHLRVAGSYQTVLEGDLVPRLTGLHMELLLAAVAVGVAIVPFAAATGWIAVNLVRPISREAHALAILLLLMSLATAFAAASFIAQFSLGSIQDRYLFYLAPLAFVGFAAFLVQIRRSWLGIVPAAVLFAWLVNKGTYLPGTGPPFFASPLPYFYPVLDGRADQVGGFLGIADLNPRDALVWGSLLAAAVLAVVAWTKPRLALVALPLVLFYCIVETEYISSNSMGATGGGNTATGNVPLPERDWVDEALPDGETAAMVPATVAIPPSLVERLWWEAGFWNKRIEYMYSWRGGATYGNIPSSIVDVDYRTGVLEAEPQHPYLVLALADVRFAPAVRRKVASGFQHLELVEVARPYRAAWTTRGEILDDGWVAPGKPVRIGLYGENGDSPTLRRVRLTLSTQTDVHAPRRYSLRLGSARVSRTLKARRTQQVWLEACVGSERGLEAVLRVPRGIKLPDGRRVAMRVLDVYSPPRPAAPCSEGRRPRIDARRPRRG